MCEWRRLVYNGKIWLLMLCLLLIQTTGFFALQLLEHENNIGEFRKIFAVQLEYYQNLPAETALDELSEEWESLNTLPPEQWENDRNQYKTAIEILYEHVSYLASYKPYLEQIQQNAANQLKLPVFSDQTSFTSKNIRQTAKDFEEILKAVTDNDTTMQIRLCHLYSLRQIFKMGTANKLLLFIFCIFLIRQLLESRKEGLYALLYTAPGGRSNLSMQKHLAFLFLTAICSVLLYRRNSILMPLMMYGNYNDLSAWIQSIPAFMEYNRAMSVGTFLTLWTVIQSAAVLICSYICLFVFSVISHRSFAFGAVGILFMTEYALFENISENSSLVLLKGFNIFSMLNAEFWYQHYLNVNIAENPVNIRIPLLCCLIAGILAAMAGNLLADIYKKPFGSRHLLERVLLRFRNFFTMLYSRLGLFAMEADKFLRMQGGIFLILAAVIIFWHLDWSVNLYINREEYLTDLVNIMQPGLNETREWQIPFGGYRLLFGTAFSRHRQLKRLLLLFMLACLSGNESWESSKNVRKLLHASSRGRKQVWQYKTAIWYLTILWLAVILWTSEYYWMIQANQPFFVLSAFVP